MKPNNEEFEESNLDRRDMLMRSLSNKPPQSKDNEDFIAENKSSFERTSSSPELSEILPRPSLLNVNNTTNDSLKDDEACNHKAVDAKSIQNTISKQIAKARQKLVSLMGVENKSSVRECKLARSTSKFYINEDLGKDIKSDCEEESNENDFFKFVFNTKNDFDEQRGNELLNRYHALGNHNESLSDYQEDRAKSGFHFGRHRQALENFEKDFCEQLLISFDENQDDSYSESDQKLRKIINQRYDTTDKSFSTCSGYCLLIENEEIAHENDVHKRKSSKIEINDKKMTCIMKYNECRRKSENGTRLPNQHNKSTEVKLIEC